MKTDDWDLVKRFQNGDESAFNRLVGQHKEDVYRLAFRFVGNHAEADDVAQEAFIRAYKALGRFRGDSSFKTWIYRITVNTAYNFLNSPHRTRRTGLDPEKMDRAVAPNILGKMEARERSDLLKKAIDQLPDRQRQTVILKVYEALKFREIAEVMNCPVGTAKANFFHGMKQLKRRLGTADTE